jgi:hypothetical protein
MMTTLEPLLTQFRARHPFGTILTELVQTEQSQALVTVTIKIDSNILASALGQGETVEIATASALKQVLAMAGFVSTATSDMPPLSFAPEKAARVSNGFVAPIEPRQVVETRVPEEERPAPRRTAVTYAPPPEPFEEEEDAFVDLSDLIAATDVQMKRLGWTNVQGRTHLSQTYGKNARKDLLEEELQDFLAYLKRQPSRRAPAADTPF